MNDFKSKVDADGSPVVLGKELMNVALYDGCLARSKLTDDQHFVQVFILWIAVSIVAGLIGITKKTQHVREKLEQFQEEKRWRKYYRLVQEILSSHSAGQKRKLQIDASKTLKYPRPTSRRETRRTEKKVMSIR